MPKNKRFKKRNIPHKKYIVNGIYQYKKDGRFVPVKNQSMIPKKQKTIKQRGNTIRSQSAPRQITQSSQQRQLQGHLFDILKERNSLLQHQLDNENKQSQQLIKEGYDRAIQKIEKHAKSGDKNKKDYYQNLQKSIQQDRELYEKNIRDQKELIQMKDKYEQQLKEEKKISDQQVQLHKEMELKLKTLQAENKNITDKFQQQMNDFSVTSVQQKLSFQKELQNRQQIIEYEKNQKIQLEEQMKRQNQFNVEAADKLQNKYLQQLDNISAANEKQKLSLQKELQNRQQIIENEKNQKIQLEDQLKKQHEYNQDLTDKYEDVKSKIQEKESQILQMVQLNQQKHKSLTTIEQQQQQQQQEIKQQPKQNIEYDVGDIGAINELALMEDKALKDELQQNKMRADRLESEKNIKEQFYQKHQRNKQFIEDLFRGIDNSGVKNFKNTHREVIQQNKDKYKADEDVIQYFYRQDLPGKQTKKGLHEDLEKYIKRLEKDELVRLDNPIIKIEQPVKIEQPQPEIKQPEIKQPEIKQPEIKQPEIKQSQKLQLEEQKEEIKRDLDVLIQKKKPIENSDFVLARMIFEEDHMLQAMMKRQMQSSLRIENEEKQKQNIEKHYDRRTKDIFKNYTANHRDLGISQAITDLKRNDEFRNSIEEIRHEADKYQKEQKQQKILIEKTRQERYDKYYKQILNDRAERLHKSAKDEKISYDDYKQQLDLILGGYFPQNIQKETKSLLHDIFYLKDSVKQYNIEQIQEALNKNVIYQMKKEDKNDFPEYYQLRKENNAFYQDITDNLHREDQRDEFIKKYEGYGSKKERNHSGLTISEVLDLIDELLVKKNYSIQYFYNNSKSSLNQDEQYNKTDQNWEILLFLHENHFTCAILDKKVENIYYFNCLGYDQKRMEYDMKHIQKMSLDNDQETTYKFKYNTNVWQKNTQQDNWECGLYTAIFIFNIVGLKLPFKDATYFNQNDEHIKVSFENSFI